MTPIDWAKRPLTKYADFSGRASRPEYWWFVLANLIVGFITSMIDSVLGLSGMIGPYGPLTILAFLALIAPSLAVGVRRLHDTGRSGLWLLLALVPLGGLVVIYFLILEGEGGANAYGALPEALPA